MNALCDAPLAKIAVANTLKPAGTRLTLLAVLPNQEPANATLLEALLPQLRAIAMLSAVRRVDWSTSTPQQFADEADWMAARIVLLGLSEVSVSLEKLSLLETANRRVLELGAAFGLQLRPAAPAIVSGQQAGVVRAVSRFIGADELAGGLIERSQKIAAACRRQLPSTLCGALGLA